MDKLKAAWEAMGRLNLKVNGYKTYLIVAIIILVAVAKFLGVSVPTEVWALLGAGGLAGLRHGVEKVEGP